MKKKSRSRITLVLTLVGAILAVAVLVVGIWSLVVGWRGTPVAAAFTRVGGAAAVETAVDASRFWLNRPQLVVETPAGASRQVMLAAAHCAMVNDAPLLFTSTNRKPHRLVEATTKRWWKKKKTAKLHIYTVTNTKLVSKCLKKNNAGRNQVKVPGVSVLQVPSQKRQLRGLQLELTPRRMLEPFVVFAAPIAPGQEPDVAVGLAVAEHLAKADGEPVSLVVIQRYLEADPKLEDMLRTQPALVRGGIVLGQTPTVPDDTRALLRQLLTTADKQGLPNQIQAFLGSAGPLIPALLALLALGAAAALAPTIIALGTSEIREVLGRTESGIRKLLGEAPSNSTETGPPPPKVPLHTRVLQRERRLRRYIMGKLGFTSPQSAPKGAEWLDALTKDELKQELAVTISLRSGWIVTGNISRPQEYKDRNVTVWQINGAQLSQDGAQFEKSRYVLVPVVDIELIRVN